MTTDSPYADPDTRNLQKIVDALYTTQDELQFQIKRLDQYVQARTAEEQQFHADLKAGYETAARYVGVLYRYQLGRLERLRRGEPMPTDVPPEDGINHRGVAAADTGEEEGEA